jgi:hypothetical protein
LLTTLGTISACDKYNEANCPAGESSNDQNFCVRLSASPGGPFGIAAPTDLYGNWCPPKYAYDVLDVTAGGVGNKAYLNMANSNVSNYAQVVNDKISSPNKYRSVVDGYSLDHLTLSTGTGNYNPGAGTDCPITTPGIVGAVRIHFTDTLKWLLNISDPLALGLCVDPCLDVTSVPGPEAEANLVNRLYQNSPNPFNPRTTIRFSLAQAAPAQLVIYDVNGRQVRTLADGPQTAGPHVLVWDGTDDAGHRVPSGIYWSKLTTAGYKSNMKMVVLK